MVSLILMFHHHHHHHQSLNREGHWCTTDDFTTSFLHFSLFSTALWDLANSRPVHSPFVFPSLFLFCLAFFPHSLCLARWFRPDLMNERYIHVCCVGRLHWKPQMRDHPSFQTTFWFFETFLFPFSMQRNPSPVKGHLSLPTTSAGSVERS